MQKVWDSVVLGGLTVVTAALAWLLVESGASTPMEGIAVVTGAISVWLTVKESAWNFPIGLVNALAFFVVFLRVRLFADMSLQAAFFVLTAVGWGLWLWGGEKRTALNVTRTRWWEMVAVVAAVVVMTAGWWGILQMVNGTATFWDALTTAISLGAQWLLNYKRLENWAFWIVADLIYIPLYLWKGLYLTSGLYAVFLVMAVMGYVDWWQRWRKVRGIGRASAGGVAGEGGVAA